MSEQSNQSNQSVQNVQSPEELRQGLLEQLEASKQTIEELTDEELENVAGGGAWKASLAVISVSGSLLSLAATAGRSEPPYKYRK